MENDSGIISFDFLGPSPVYPAGGGFGNGAIDLGGLEVYEALYFKKIWETHNGGPKGLGASFYEPTSIPKGFNLIGHFCKPNSKTMVETVLIAKDTTGHPSRGALSSPIDYTLIWNSKGLNLSQLDGYIWLPIPPNGYKAIGHIVTTSPEKPSLDKVKCVRSEFTDITIVGKWIWGHKIRNYLSIVDLHITKPKTKVRSVPTGMFLARNGSSTHELACLRMIKSDLYSYMPHSSQVDTMIKSYAPWVYFHPDEQYFPSSVSWFFQTGAELHQPSQPPSPVAENGDNLPNTGTPEDSFLDLPTDEAKKETVKKGFLAVAYGYLHVKSALGGTHTDLAIWLYYPFNGGGNFQFGPFIINLGKIGQHVSDWEHITLRVDNFRGSLKAIYLSQHSKGKWLAPTKFEFMNRTRPVVYASLHGHAHYATPNSFMHLAGNLDPTDVDMLYHEFLMNNSIKAPVDKRNMVFGFGVRDDAAKSNNVMDIAATYYFIGNDYIDFPTKPWVKYTGRWGPKITYGFTKEVLKITEALPKMVKELAIKLLHKLPAELLGEEGPPGPKMKESWSGDERE